MLCIDGDDRFWVGCSSRPSCCPACCWPVWLDAPPPSATCSSSSGGRMFRRRATWWIHTQLNTPKSSQIGTWRVSLNRQNLPTSSPLPTKTGRRSPPFTSLAPKNSTTARCTSMWRTATCLMAGWWGLPQSSQPRAMTTPLLFFSLWMKAEWFCEPAVCDHLLKTTKEPVLCMVGGSLRNHFLFCS